MFHQLIGMFLLSSIISSVSAFCTGGALCRITFTNFTFDNFGDLPGFPADGLLFSPLAGVTHSKRQSFLIVRGFAIRAVEDIAETGNNNRFIRRANKLLKKGEGVLSVVDAQVPTSPGFSNSFIVAVNCNNPFLTVLGMISPSPDWFVQINNVNLFDIWASEFVPRLTGDLIAYEAGVDDGREFTPRSDRSLDLPTVPRLNIAPLVEDDTDRFDGRVVGRYTIQRIRTNA